ncbi:phage virion morphogenesis protein [Klebsiella pneumoniae]|uniref:Phage virion morphogenesis protein n=1 Tax=Klebsiella pneumoniae TaxID=573 RepID=A0A939NQ66_KLEPN|nr:phage virion morphogenesis protein [Klebsiella pneumoniae]MBO2025548.1 phage virion morphogenesis protein [Klebsiella pneumoniae]
MDDWLSALLANLEPAARSRMMRQLAQELRRTQQQNIRMQRNPDGSSYEPRRVTARSKKAVSNDRCLQNFAPQNT